VPAIPKHERAPRKVKRTQSPLAENVTKVVVTGPDFHHTAPSRAMQHDINHVAGLSDVEASLDWIAEGIKRLTHADHAVSLSVSQGPNTNPVQLTLAGNDYDDTMGQLVTAVERIADSLARLAGLTRPRLESWHEQEEYEPRYKDIACDGGAPGPAHTQAEAKTQRS
jgi:hypothetical protein